MGGNHGSRRECGGIRFPERSSAYQALSVLKQADADGRIELRAAAVVERTPEGQLRIPEGADKVGLEAAEEATEAAAKGARQKMRETAQGGGLSEKFSERVGKLKDRLRIS